MRAAIQVWNVLHDIVYIVIKLNVTKTRNGLEFGLANGLSQFLWNASFITVLLF